MKSAVNTKKEEDVRTRNRVVKASSSEKKVLLQERKNLCKTKQSEAREGSPLII